MWCGWIVVDCWFVGVEDFGFFECDFFVCVVKVFGMVDVDVCDDCIIGIDDVDCIELVVEVDFENYCVEFVCCE